MNFYSEECKRIINKFKKMPQEHLLIAISKMLRSCEKSWKNNGVVINPLILLQMLRLTIEYSDKSYNTINELKHNDVINLYNCCHELISPDFYTSKDKFSFEKFMRLIIHKQSWFQEKCSRKDIGRLLLMFDELPKESIIKKVFKEKTSLDILIFLEISMFIFTWFNESRQSQILLFFSREYLSTLKYNKEQINQYLELLATPVENITRSLEQYRREKYNCNGFSLYFSEPFPVEIIPPMLKLGDRLLSYSQNVFRYYYKHCIYHTIKSDAKAYEKWGKCFENYVGNLLRECKIDYIAEKRLKNILQGKVVDYLHPNLHSNILIECKGVEMPLEAKMKQDNRTLKERTKWTVIKAIKQAYSVINSVQNVNIEEILQKEKFSLIIVTYKELILPQGERMWNEYLHECNFKYYAPEKLPSENIFLMSIDQFEYFLASNNLHKSLEEITKEEKIDKTRSLLIQDYLLQKNLVDLTKLGFIDKKFNSYFDKLISKCY